MIPCAYLRAFHPLDSYPEEERSGWERYILSGGHPPAPRPTYREEGVTRGVAGLLAPADGDRHAEVRLVDGRYYICPWRMQLRVLASILAFREAVPDDVADVFVPEVEVRRAARELARIRRRDPAAVPTILQSPWHVPIRWFVLVDDQERRLVEAGPGRFRLYYWTPIEDARRRAERAFQTLRRTELAGVTELMRELVQWLSSFDTPAVVELDYASVSALFSWDELDNDHSGREIQQAISAIGRRGGLDRATDLYQSVALRWAEVRSRESLN